MCNDVRWRQQQQQQQQRTSPRDSVLAYFSSLLCSWNPQLLYSPLATCTQGRDKAGGMAACFTYKNDKILTCVEYERETRQRSRPNATCSS
jgi:hypothetical protein